MLNEKLNSKAKEEKARKIQAAIGLSSLVLVFMAVSFVKESPVENLEQSSIVTEARSVASLHPTSTVALDNSWQKNLASRIAELPEVPSGRTARPPNNIEKLIFGDLKGLYSMHVKEDKISEMLLKQKDATDAPKYMGDEIAFLENNKELWWVNFSKSSVKERNPQKSIITLMDSAQQVVGEAYFSWGESGKLLSLKIDKM